MEHTEHRPRLPMGVWALGFVSLLMDMSSELVHSLLPVFVVGTLGASVLVLGVLEGVAEAATLFIKMFSGALSDYVGRRKALVVIGYGLSALTKPAFALATTVGWVFTARLVDRVGKGIRGAPRDALLADITEPSIRGAAFGLRQSLDTIGAVLGPLLAIGLMVLLASDVRAVLWFAVVPAAIAVIVLVVAVREPERKTVSRRQPIRWSTVSLLPRAFWWVVAVGGILTLARFSEAFLILRAEDVGLGAAYVPIVAVVMSAAYALSAYPAGLIADRTGPNGLLAGGLAVLIVADLVLAAADATATVLAGAALWGLHMGLTQGLLSKLIADSAPPTLRGTAFGLFSLVSGVAMLIASVVAGWLWDASGPEATFMAGAGFAALACAALFGRTIMRTWRRAGSGR